MTTTSIDLGGGIRVHPGIMTPELVPAGDLTEHPQNPRKGDLDAIGESLDTNGLYDQIKVQRSTGYILAGNHTYRTLTSKGAERVPVVFLDCDNTEALRIMTSANATADRGDYDRRLLVQILDGELAGEVAGTGYYDGDLDVFRRAAEAEDVFAGVGAEHMLDEFRDIDPESTTKTEYNPADGYIARAVVYLYNPQAIEEFRRRLDFKAGLSGLPAHADGYRIATWKRYRSDGSEVPASEDDA